MSNIPPRRGDQSPPPRGATSSNANTPTNTNRSAPPRRPSKEYNYEEEQYEEVEQPTRRPARNATGQGQASGQATRRSRSGAGTRGSADYDSGQGSRPRNRPAQPRYVAPRRDTFPIVMGAVVGMLVVGVMIAVYLFVTRTNGNVNPPSPTANTNTNTGTATQPTAAPTMAQNTNASGIQTMQAIRPANGLGTPMPDEGNNHVDETQAITYTNYPPTSGTHYGATTQYGFHEEQIPDGQSVHSLEHGAIVLYYKPDIAADIKQQLKDAYTRLPQSKYGKVKMAIVPYTNMKTPLAIAAWDRLLPITTYNYEEVQTFYNQWVDKGPEDVP